MQKNKFSILYLINTIFLWSTYEVLSKTVIDQINPFQVNFFRFLLGGLILFAVVLVKEKIQISKKDFLWVVLLGIISVALSMNMLQLSLYIPYAKASVAAVIFSSNPIFVVLFAAIIDKEKVEVHKVVGLIVGILGIVIVFLEKLQFQNLDIRSPLLALGASITFALYTVLGRSVAIRMGSLKMNAFSFLAGSLVCLPFLLIFKVPIVTFDYSIIPQVLYMGIFVTGLAYLTYFKGLSIFGASNGSLVFFIKPVLASVFAILFLKEKATLNLVAGTFVILIGLFIALRWDAIKQITKRERRACK